MITLGTSASGAFAASAVSSAPSVRTAVGPPAPQTRAHLEQSMRGEAYANASYRLYAEQARREGLPAVARLFDRTADVELNEHFASGAALSGQVKDDAANLRDAIAGEHHESRQMYPGFAREAESAGDTAAADRFTEIAGDEAKHARAFGTALGVAESGRGSVPTAPEVHPVTVTAGAPNVQAQRTKENLDKAIHGEALAYAKYRLYGEHAQDPAVGRLFRGTGEVELHEHLSESANLAGLVGTTHENLTKAITGERYESETMYPTFAERAKAAGDAEAARAFSHNADDEAGHARSFEQARERLSGS
ncbi:ferritin family protein [Actinoallomurus sp. NPDC052308]|uniref:ferritin family protein n=1 Tax=Actinoallomurus sp. NPDC052308 TaxID=3155530 RepID=UPI003428FF07